MMNVHKTFLRSFLAIVYVLATIVVAAHGAAPTEPQSHLQQGNHIGTFSKFKQGDVLYVGYRTRWCFGGGRWALVFERGKTFTVTMAEVPRWWTAPSPFKKDSGCTVFGTTTLSASDIKGLDALFTWYRSPRSYGCTTVETITCTLVRQGIVVATEEFVDGSCDSYEHEEFTLLGELLQRVGGIR